VSTLVTLARSWNFPAELKLDGTAFESLGYDKNQRAYVLTCKSVGTPAALEFTLDGGDQSPVLNPALVVKNWGDSNVKLTMNGKAIPRGKDFRFGHLQTLDGADLIVWITDNSKTSSYIIKVQS